MTRYRAWLAEYFQTEFNYEATLFMNLNKVREFILSEGQSNSGNAAKAPTAPNFNYPREYDLVVRVDEILAIKPELAQRILTGGRRPDVKVQFDMDAKKKTTTVEESKSIKISDTAAM